LAESRNLRSIVIAGGGSAGWMAAAALGKALGGTVRITLVESEEIGTVGVGEATIPPIQLFNSILGIDEGEFLHATRGTIKLGIEFVDWLRPGHRYFHPFGSFGDDFGLTVFHQHWLRARALGAPEPFEAYSLNHQAAYAGRFRKPVPGLAPVFTTFAYAYHFDAGLYARLLRDYAEQRGVERLEGLIAQVERDAEGGDIRSLVLRDGRRIEGDFFLDCTGFRALLIGGALEVPYEDWSAMLPVDRALAVPTERIEAPVPFTRSTARPAGWQWRIPLQHRTGNGHVYASGFIDDEAAREVLLANLDAPPTGEMRQLRFTTGRRARMWERNCVAVGLASGFLEPLESTSIHLVQAAVTRLLALFPSRDDDPLLRREYNLQSAAEFERIRDFLVLHYKATERSDSDFWNHVRTMAVPDTLAEKIELFAATGRLAERGRDLFQPSSWLAVMMGQGIMPRSHDPLTATIPPQGLAKILAAMRATITQAVAQMPAHEEQLRAMGGLSPD
jgi:tryptophan halogenase